MTRTRAEHLLQLGSNLFSRETRERLEAQVEQEREEREGWVRVSDEEDDDAD